MRLLSTDSGQTDNRLLAMLPPADFKRIKPSLERVDLPHGQTIIPSFSPIDHVYFLETGMVSLVQPLNDGTLVEVGVVGKEGMVGTPVLLGAQRCSVEAMVQMPGVALRLPVKALLDITKRNSSFHASLLQFTQSLFVHISQSAACNARHLVEQRLARWLLLAHDRAEGDELNLSHEFLAIMLGIRRAGVSVAVAKFRRLGLILPSRGRIEILDRKGLEETACECYRAVTTENQLLLV